VSGVLDPKSTTLENPGMVVLEIVQEIFGECAPIISSRVKGRVMNILIAMLTTW